MSALLDHKQLAAALGLSPGTVRNIWQSFPFIPITPSARAKPNLRGVRFVLEEVLEYCREQAAKGGGYGYPTVHGAGRTLPGLLQVSGTAFQQDRAHHSDGQSMGGGNEKTIVPGGGAGLSFDVFAGG